MIVTLKKWQIMLLIFMTLFSFSVSVILISDINKPQYYNLLFILPLIFALYLTIYSKLFKSFFYNLGATMILGFLFIRLAISPLFFVLGGYNGKIILNIESNTPKSILLVAYETIAIMTTLFLLIKKNYYTDDNIINDCLFDIDRKYVGILFILIIIQMLIFAYTPGLLEGYRSILDISDPKFTHLEQSYINEKYITSFGTKLSLVTGNYLMKILRLILPNIIIIWINRRRSMFRQLLSYFIILIHLFIIDGSVARSIIYMLISYMLISYIYPYNRIRKIAKMLIISFIVVIFYWIFRLNLNGGEINKYFSSIFNSYFSGVNIVSGSLNLPRNIEIRLQYFLYDFFKSIPYGNTIFGLKETDSAIYFNLINGTSGQIPTTIGSGYYYFGFLLSPIYSIIFTIMAYKMGEKANQVPLLISKVRYLFLTICFSMGIVMYNILITLTNIFSVAVPLYIIEIFAYGKNKNLSNNKIVKF